MNATIVSRNRAGLESEPTPGCPGIARSALRRRTPRRVLPLRLQRLLFRPAALDDHGLSGRGRGCRLGGVPVLIDTASLRDYCQDKENGIRLMDGGVNDNQGLMEIYMILSELACTRHAPTCPSSIRLRWSGCMPATAPGSSW